MSLEKKFSEIKQDCGYGDYITLGNCGNDFPKQCVQMCDEFAVGFAEWKDDNCSYSGQDINDTSIRRFYFKTGSTSNVNRTRTYTTTELLEIYKQGL